MEEARRAAEEPIKRYDIAGFNITWKGGTPVEQQRDTGKYVRFKDHANALAEKDKVIEGLRRLAAYAEHKWDCTFGAHVPGRGDPCESCSCGLDEVKRALGQPQE